MWEPHIQLINCSSLRMLQLVEHFMINHLSLKKLIHITALRCLCTTLSQFNVSNDLHKRCQTWANLWWRTKCPSWNSFWSKRSALNLFKQGSTKIAFECFFFPKKLQDRHDSNLELQAECETRRPLCHQQTEPKLWACLSQIPFLSGKLQRSFFLITSQPQSKAFQEFILWFICLDVLARSEANEEEVINYINTVWNWNHQPFHCQCDGWTSC